MGKQLNVGRRSPWLRALGFALCVALAFGSCDDDNDIFEVPADSGTFAGTDEEVEGTATLNGVFPMDTPCATARTCESAGANCGYIGDGCGSELSCDINDQCAYYECGTQGQPNVCGDDSVECVPLSCADVGATCGIVGDGCGWTEYCGGCMIDEQCGATTANVCGTPSEPLPRTTRAGSVYFEHLQQSYFQLYVELPLEGDVSLLSFPLDANELSGTNIPLSSFSGFYGDPDYEFDPVPLEGTLTYTIDPEAECNEDGYCLTSFEGTIVIERGIPFVGTIELNYVDEWTTEDHSEGGGCSSSSVSGCGNSFPQK